MAVRIRPRFLIIMFSKALRDMRKFIEKMTADYRGENATFGEWMVYGVVVPLFLIALCGIAGSIIGF